MQNASKVHEGLTMINMICVATHAERTHTHTHKVVFMLGTSLFGANNCSLHASLDSFISSWGGAYKKTTVTSCLGAASSP